MKSNFPLWMSGGLLGATALFFYSPLTDASPASPASKSSPGNEAPSAAGERVRPLNSLDQSETDDSTFASQGLLWEQVARSDNQAMRSVQTIRKTAFAPVRNKRIGDRVRLELSPRIPVINSVVKQRAVQADGTVVTHLVVPGSPQGELMIQENEAAGFFLGQLFYRDHPVAYEFKKSNRGLTATRHPVSNLICSIVSPDLQLVRMGLPRPEIGEAPGNGKGGGGGNGGGGGGGGGDSRTISISDASVVEGNSGSTSLTFTFDLSSSDKKNDISVDFATSDGSATAPSDYISTSGTVVFPRRSKRTTISIPVVGDDLLEGDETFTVTLSNPSGAAIGNGSATGTIVNDDLGPSLYTYDIQATEGDSGSATVHFTVELSPTSETTVSVNYSTADGTALAGEDYNATSGSLVFEPGETSKTVGVAIFGDMDYENGETFSLFLSGPSGAVIQDGQATCLIVNDDANPSGVPILNSLPGAAAVAFLDMDGHVTSGTNWNNYFNGGNDIVARGVAGTLGETGMTNVWKRVAEDFAPFDINVTTDESVYLAAPPSMRTRCVITPDNEWYGSAGGVAYIGSFTWTGDTPCWTFSDMLSNSPRYIAEATSHEIGHTLGLYHDGRSDPQEGYYTGHGSGETGWAPIMGVGYYKLLVQWSKGEYLNANNTEDDLAIITSRNGFGYRTDDHADTSGSATALDQNGSSVSGDGLIETENDTDVFSFSVTAGGLVDLQVESPSISPNLDILAEIRDSNGALLAADNDPAVLRANLVVDLEPGVYFLFVGGTGKGDVQGTGYSDYGSLGTYSISGQMP